MDILPAILVKNRDEYYQQINAIDHIVPRIHIDIADNTLVPNETWADPMMVQDATPCDIDLHLMVDNPYKVLEAWADVPQVKRVIVHVEAKRMSQETLKNISSPTREIYIARNPGTPLTSLSPYLGKTAGVLFMCIEPGFQGQPFLPQVLEDITAFHAQYPNKTIMADGHVDETTLAPLAAAGATHLCIGSAIFHREEPPESQYKKFLDAVSSLT